VELSQLVPTTTPTVTRDPWECVTEKIPGYFQVPKPTKSLEEAIFSYARSHHPCTETESRKCRMADKTQWCGFQTAAPLSLLPEYSSYGNTASEWWASQSSNAVSVARKCPNSWYDAGTQHPANMGWLNLTIVMAECYADAHVTPTVPTIQSTLAPPGRTNAIHPTKTVLGNSASGQSANAKMLMVAATGIAYAAINELW